jgi:predicted dehydrogenase
MKIGLLGAGHLGKIHLTQLLTIPDIEFVGFFDIDENVRENVSEKFNVKAFDSPEKLIESCDAVDIVTPTLSHFEYASNALRNRKHIFIEKPFTHTLDEAKILLSLGEESECVIQVGHVERFNPAFRMAEPSIENPMFIEAHRLAQFNPRGTDVSVVSDLMIHDIDIVLSIVKSRVKKIHAGGVAVVSETPDICNARIEFENGCTANLTASRISMKNMRKMRMFQKNAYISVDFLSKETEILKLRNHEGPEDPFAITIDLGNNKGKKEIFFEKPEIPETNAIRNELEQFVDCVKNHKKPSVTGHDGFHAMEVVSQILEKLKFTSGLLE